MVVRMWRGWAAEDSADDIATHLRTGALARYATQPGFVSAELLERSLAGGVELLTLTVWESDDCVPPGVEESHRLLVARETLASTWSLVDVPTAVAQAA